MISSSLILGTGDIARASTSLTVSQITWDVIGLDSNNVSVGPNRFPVGHRICAVGGAAPNVEATFLWTSENANINLQVDSKSTVELGDLTAGQCADAYFNVEITRLKAAWLTSRRYVVTATSTTSAPPGTPPVVVATQTSPTPRQVLVEKLVSQNRNSTKSIKVNGTLLPSGIVTDLVEGGIYDIELNSATTTQGYEQLETFLGMRNDIFKILSVRTAYSANTSTRITDIEPDTPGLQTSTFYADSCGWEPNPLSPNYRTCVGGAGKTGGNDILTTYRVQIIGGAGTEQTLLPMLYDFSGSSYHYNSDFSTASRRVRIGTSAASISAAKSFDPKKILPDGTSTLTLSITNNSSFRVDGVGVTDPLPTNMTVASVPPNPLSASCGATASLNPALTVGANSISLINASLATGATCTITVPVEVSGVSGTEPVQFSNTTGPVTINGVSTGVTATDTLTAQGSPPACRTSVDIATWAVASNSSNPPTATVDRSAGASIAASIVGTSPNFTAYVTTPGRSGASDGSWATEQHNYDLTSASDQRIRITLSGLSSYDNLQLNFYARSASSGPTGMTVSFPNTNVAPASTTVTPSTPSLRSSTFQLVTVSLSGIQRSGSPVIEINGTGAAANNQSGALFLDDISVTGSDTGCLPTEPSFGKSFSPDPITKNAQSTLTFSIDNTQSGGGNLSSVAFTDPLPSGIVVGDITATPPTYSSGCGDGTLENLDKDDTTLDFSGASIDSGEICTISVVVEGVSGGTWTNTTSLLNYTVGAVSVTSSTPATDTLTVLVPPTISKSFSPASVLLMRDSILTFQIVNPNSATTLTGISFLDTLPAGITHSTTSSTPQCGGTLTLTPPSTISLTAGELTAGEDCSFAVTVKGTTVGLLENSTTVITSTEAGNGTTAEADLLVSEPYVSLDLNKRILLQDSDATAPDEFSNWLKFATATRAGQVPWYLFMVTNSGEVGFTSPAITDPTLGTFTCMWYRTRNEPDDSFVGLVDDLGTAEVDESVLAPGDSAFCLVGPREVIPAKSSSSNTATVTATRTDTNTPVSSKTSTATAFGLPITLDKTADVSSFESVGQVITYTFLVKNEGGVSVLGPVEITDDKIPSVSCPALSGVGNNDAFFDPGESVTCSGTYTVTNSDVSAGIITNIAYATVENTEAGSDDDVRSANDSVVLKLGKISLTKQPDKGFFVVDDPLTPEIFENRVSYTYRVTNTGAVALPGPVTVHDDKTTVSCGLVTAAQRLEPIEPDPGAGDSNLDPGEYVDCTATYTTTVQDIAAGLVTNTARASVGPTNDPNNLPIQSSDVEATVYHGEISIQKTANKTYFVNATPADTITYSYVVRNNGTASLAGEVTVTDTKIEAPNAVSCSPVSTAQKDGPSGPIAGNNNSSLDQGEFVTCSATYTVTEVDVAAGLVTNSARAVVDGVRSPDDTVTVPFGQISFDKTADKTSVSAVGEKISYTYVLRNNGTSTLSGPLVVLDNRVNEQPQDDQVVCPYVANLQPGASVTCTATYTVTNADLVAGSIVNTATATLGELAPVEDTVTVAADNPVADVKVEKVVDVSTPDDGDLVVFTITVTNDGPSTVDDVVLTDVFPDGFVAAETTPVVCHPDTPGVCETAPTVADLEAGVGPFVLVAGEFYSIQVSGTVDYDVVTDGVFTNAATVTSTLDPFDPDTPGNNKSEQTVTISPVADLSVTKSNGVGIVQDDEWTEYTITVRNNGPSSVTGAILTDTLPLDSSIEAITCTSALLNTCNTSSYPSASELTSGFALPTMVDGSIHEFVVRVSVVGSGTPTFDPFVNAVEVVPPAGTTDPDEENNDDSDSDSVSSAPVVDLSVTRNNFAYWLKVGQTTTYTLRVTNSGPAAVTGARLFDPPVDQLDVTHVECATPDGGTCSGFDLLPTDPVGISRVKSALRAPKVTSDQFEANPNSGLILPYMGVGDTYAIRVTGIVTEAARPLFVSQVRTMAGNEFQSTAIVVAPPGSQEANLDNNEAEEEDAVPPGDVDIVDLEITKSNGVDRVQYSLPGPPLEVIQVTYTITVVNNGPDSADGTILIDDLPQWLHDPSANESVVPAINCAIAPDDPDDSETCDLAPSAQELEDGFAIPSLPAGSTFTITVSGPAPLIDPSIVEISNTASVKPPVGVLETNNVDQDEEYEISDTDLDELTFPVADLSVMKSNGTSFAENGDQTTYTITVRNNGPAPMDDPKTIGTIERATLTDVIPSWLTNVSITCGTNTSDPNETCSVDALPTREQLASTFDLPDLANGATFTIRVTGTIQTNDTSITNVATVSAPSHIKEGNSANNSSTDITYLVPVADLVVTKSDNVARIRNGSETSYVITVTNLGPSSVEGAILEDPVVAGLTVLRIECGSPSGLCTDLAIPTVEELQVGYALPELGLGSSYSIIVTMKTSTTRSRVINTAHISVPDGYLDPDSSNNMSMDQNDVTHPKKTVVDIITDGPLSNTGSDVARLLYVAGLLIVFGGSILMSRRRRLIDRDGDT